MSRIAINRVLMCDISDAPVNGMYLADIWDTQTCTQVVLLMAQSLPKLYIKLEQIKITGNVFGPCL